MSSGQIKAWDEASGKPPLSSEDRVPKHQKIFLPCVTEETDGPAAGGSAKGKRSTLEKSKNCPSQITVLGKVDDVYHNPPADLTNATVAKLPKSTMTRINKARRNCGRNLAPIKLHRRWREEVDSDEEDRRPPSGESLTGVPTDILLPPEDFINEFKSGGPMEAKYKGIRDDLEFKDAAIRMKERELDVLKEMRELKKKQKKLGKSAVSATMALFKQTVTNVVPRVNNANNAVGAGAKQGGPKAHRDGAATAAKKNEKNLEHLTSGVDVARDRNRLVEGAGMSLMTQRLAKNNEQYLAASDHKKQYPHKRIFESPYGHTGQGGVPLQRVLNPTKLPTGSNMMKHLVAQEDAAIVAATKGLNLTGVGPQLLEHQRALLEGRDIHIKERNQKERQHQADSEGGFNVLGALATSSASGSNPMK